MNDLPESNDPTPAEAASASAPAPRRRAPRKTAAAVPAEPTAAAPETVAEVAAEAPAAAPAKAPRRRSPARDASPIEQAAAAAAESLAAPVAAVEASAEPVAEVKPKAPRKRKVAEAADVVAEAAAEAVPVVGAVAVEASPAEPAPKRPRSRKPAADVSSPADAAPAPAEVVVEAAPVDVAVTETAGDTGEAAEGQAPQDRNARRRERRNRRDRDRPRGNGEDGAPVAAAPAEGAGDEAAAVDGAIVAEPVDAGELFAEVLSGQFDVEVPEEVAAEPTKRVLRPEPEAPKLHKVLAQSGVGSRRDMEQLIQDGQVTVNGEVAHVGMRIAHGDQIKIAGRPVKVRIAPGPARILAYHKPVGEVVTHHDPEGRPTVFRGLPRLPSGKWLSVGRLDINTEGLLLFTSSGELANQLMHPRFGVEREYAVRVLGKLEEGDRAQLLEGVDVDGQRAAFKAIADGGGEGVNHWYRVIIAEGRNREVRKLFDTVGLTVSRLIRIRYGTVVLPRGLKRGVWVELGEDDVRAIRRLAHAPRDGAGQPPREPQGEAPQGQPLQQGRGQQPQRGQQPGKGPKGQQGQQGQQFQGGQGGQGGPNGRQGGQGGQGGGQGQGQGKQRGKHGGKPAFGGQGGQGGQGGNFEQRRPDARAEMRPPRVDGPRADAPPRDDRDDRYDDDIPTHIPNPLEQTFDRRFATGSKRISAGFGRPTEEPVGGRGNGPRKGGSGPREPDPLQTSVGYIGADAYFSKPGGGGGKNRGGGGRRR